jgi:hypothetical protein
MPVARPEAVQQIEVEALLHGHARLAAGDLGDPRARQQLEQHAEQLVLLAGVLRPRRDDHADPQHAIAVAGEPVDRQRRRGAAAGERLLGRRPVDQVDLLPEPLAQLALQQGLDRLGQRAQRCADVVGLQGAAR